jgi:allophanate hydrolase subunit 2
MSDCPTTGGYTKIATVIGADLPLLAQCPIGSGRVRFRPTTVEAAQERYRETMDGLRMAIEA